MNVGAQIAVRRDLENLADVDDEGPRNWRRVDPTVLGLDLQSCFRVLQEDG